MAIDSLESFDAKKKVGITPCLTYQIHVTVKIVICDDKKIMLKRQKRCVRQFIIKEKIFNGSASCVKKYPY
jgi:hypothetical protein